MCCRPLQSCLYCILAQSNEPESCVFAIQNTGTLFFDTLVSHKSGIEYLILQIVLRFYRTQCCTRAQSRPCTTHILSVRMCDLSPFLSGGNCTFYIPPSYGDSRPAYRSRPWWAFQKYCCRDGSNPMPGLDQRKRGEIIKVCDNCVALLKSLSSGVRLPSWARG